MSVTRFSIFSGSFRRAVSSSSAFAFRRLFPEYRSKIDRTDSGCIRPRASSALPMLLGGRCPRCSCSRPNELEFAPATKTTSRMATKHLITSHSSLMRWHVLKVNTVAALYERRLCDGHRPPVQSRLNHDAAHFNNSFVLPSRLQHEPAHRFRKTD